MATIDEILESMTITDTIDEVIVINPNTRQLNIPGNELIFGVESDNKSERKHFLCPRYVGNNLDLSGCFIRINYRNANGEMDSHLVNDVAITGDGEYITFSWELAEKVTAYKGSTIFVVCAVGPDGLVKWYTTQGIGIVMVGLEPEIDVSGSTADAITQLIAMVNAQTEAVKAEGATQIAAVKATAQSAQNAVVAQIEAKGVNTLNSIPTEYTALSKVVDTLTRGRAGAIVCEVEGNAITVDDASDMAMQGIRIFGRSTQVGDPSPENPVEIVSVESPTVTVAGKNLLGNNLPTHTSGGITYTSNADGSITLNGTSTSESYFIFDHKNKIPIQNAPMIASLGGGNGTLALAIGCYKNDGSIVNSLAYVVDKDIQVAYPNDAATTRNYLVVGNGRSFTNKTVYPMLRAIGATADYEPYKPIQTVETMRSLRGIPVASGGNFTDENGQQWIGDEVDLGRGVYIQRIGDITFDGSQTYHINVYQQGYGYYVFGCSRFGASYTNAPVMCDRLTYKPWGSWNMVTGGDLICYETSSFYFYLKDQSIRTVEAFAEYLTENPIRALYAMAVPTETPLTETEIASYRALHSNYPNTTILNDSGAYMAVKYAADTKLYIDKKIKEALL